MDEKRSFIGQFLIAEEELVDPNFFQTVILIVDHNDKGALGLVINRQGKNLVSEILPHFHDHPLGTFPIYYGGPVQPDYLFVLHGDLPGYYGSENSFVPTQGVYFEPDSLRMMEFLMGCTTSEIKNYKSKLRFYLGYSGWGYHQLEQEIDQKSWTQLSSLEDLVFHDQPSEIWLKALRLKGGVHKILADYGWKPSLN